MLYFGVLCFGKPTLILKPLFTNTNAKLKLQRVQTSVCVSRYSRLKGVEGGFPFLIGPKRVAICMGVLWRKIPLQF